MGMLGSFLNTLVDILYPPACIVCKSKLKKGSSLDKLICLDCWAKVKKNLPPFCHRCGRHLDSRLIKNICPDCIRTPLCFDRAFSPCLYEGVIKELIQGFKYKNKEYLGLTLSNLMVEFIKEYTVPMDAVDYIVPVPLHKIRLREREFNQAQVLGNYTARYFNKVVLNDTLVRLRNTRTQTELEKKHRFHNVKGSFSVTKKGDIKSKNILLVDDVLTSGATSSECARALKDAGAHIVFTITLAN